MKVEANIIIIHISNFLVINQFSCLKPEFQMLYFKSYSAFSKFVPLNFDFFPTNL